MDILSQVRATPYVLQHSKMIITVMALWSTFHMSYQVDPFITREDNHKTTGSSSKTTTCIVYISKLFWLHQRSNEYQNICKLMKKLLEYISDMQPVFAS